jgi:hypothetical protein
MILNVVSTITFHYFFLVTSAHNHFIVLLTKQVPNSKISKDVN